MISATRHTDIWLVRHPETDWNRQRRYQSDSDRPLTSFGHARLAAIVHRLRRIRLDAIVSSGQVRTDTLAEALAADRQWKASLIRDERWREASHGAWEGLTHAEVMKRYPAEARRRFADPWRSREHGGESLMDVWTRVEAAWDELLTSHMGGHLLIITHATPIQLLLCRLLGTSFERYWQFRIDLGSLSNIDLYPSGAIVRKLNELPWRTV